MFGIKTRILQIMRRIGFRGSSDFWERNYQRGGTSGHGSYGILATYKADFLHTFVRNAQVQSVIEFGCGDGNQLSLSRYPDYIGIDVSETAVNLCRARFKTDASKSFCSLDEYDGQQADAVLSLDVIYHLVEDPIYDAYMRRLFSAAQRWVIIYSTCFEEPYRWGAHMRHRDFRPWIEQHAKGWVLCEHAANPHRPQSACQDSESTSLADFFIYERSG